MYNVKAGFKLPAGRRIAIIFRKLGLPFLKGLNSVLHFLCDR